MASSSSNSEACVPFHLCFFLLTLLIFLGFTSYLNYEPMVESFMDQLKITLMVSPLFLLIILHLLSKYNYGNDVGNGGRGLFSSSLIPLPERDSLHRAGGTPWGVGLLLVLLLFMISYRSSFTERWFPLVSR